MSVIWWTATGCAVVTGAACAPSLIAYGLRRLAQPGASSRRNLTVGIAVGAASGAIAVLAARQAGTPWWLPALLVWTLTLAAAAICDMRTRRIPSNLILRGAAVTVPLLVAAGAATGDWRALAVTAVACIASGGMLALCWRFVGVGFGDVRLAAAGGLGLGHVTHTSLLLGVLAFAVLCAAQAIFTYGRTRDRKAQFALAPAMVLGFLAAAAA